MRHPVPKQSGISFINKIPNSSTKKPTIAMVATYLNRKGKLDIEPKLTKELRKKLNDKVEQINSVIRHKASEFNRRHRTDDKEIWLTPNYDTIYEGHRFCDDGF